MVDIIPFVLFFLFTVVIPLASFLIANKGLPRKKKKLETPAEEEYSSASQQILNLYGALPQANRPYANIEYILHGLDVKYSIPKVNSHHYPYFSFVECYCSKQRACPMPEYRAIRDGILEISQALEKQQRDLEIAGVQDALAAGKDLLASLKAEKNLIDQVTRELTS